MYVLLQSKPGDRREREWGGKERKIEVWWHPCLGFPGFPIHVGLRVVHQCQHQDSWEPSVIDQTVEEDKVNTSEENC